MTEARHTEGVMNTSGRYVLSKKGETIAACQNSDDARLTALLERWEELRNKTVDDMVALGCHPEANHIGGRLIYLDQCITELRSTLNP